MNGTVVGREDATPELLFDVMSTLIARLERSEEIISLLAGLTLTGMGKVRAPDDETYDVIVAQLADYMLLVGESREQAVADLAFLNAHE